jgi:pimeloyl-ACP methyl ester carboxylesterase
MGTRPALALVFALVATACSTDSQSVERPPAMQATYAAAPCPSVQPHIKALETAKCGVLTVPENRTKKNGRTIRLVVATIPAQSSNKKTDPIVFLEGGPGDTALGGADFLVAARVNRDRDVIILTQRGTLYADLPLTCPEIDEFNRRAVSMVYDAESTGKQQVAATRECHDRLVTAGHDLSAYNTTENAADVADLRKAMGVQEWNLYGFSYGTILAQAVMRDHPEGVRSVMIDSVVPADLVTLAGTWSQFAEAFNNMFRGCEAQPDCRRRYPDLASTLNRLVNELEAKPLTVVANPPQGGPPTQVVIDGGALLNVLLGVPFSMVPSVITELAKGNPAPLAEARAASSQPLDPPLGLGMQLSTICAEWIPFAPESEVVEAGKKVLPTYPDSVLRQAPQLPFAYDNCRVWDVPKASERMRQVPTNSIPTLVINGTFDPKTAPTWAKHVADRIPNAIFVAIPGAGHWSSARSPCANDVIASFYNDPTGKPDLTCVQALKVPPFA